MVKKNKKWKKEKAARRGVAIPREMAEALKRQEQRFIEKFGRPPGPDDPIFFDPTADIPRPIIDEVLDQHLLEAMHRAGVHPAIIHAYQMTGRLVTRENERYLGKAELKDWQDAIDERYETHGGK